MENPRLFTERYIYNINDNGQGGHMLEVDIQCLKSLHHYHKCYPLCSERKLIKTATSSNFQLNLNNKLKISNDHVEK